MNSAIRSVLLVAERGHARLAAALDGKSNAIVLPPLRPRLRLAFV